VSETAATITLGWTPVPGAVGYTFSVNGVRKSSTFDPMRSTVRFGKVAGATYGVTALGKLASGKYPKPLIDHPPSFWTGPLGNANPVPDAPGAFLIDYPGRGGGDYWDEAKLIVKQREQAMGRQFDALQVYYWGGGTVGGVSKCGFDRAVADRRFQWAHDNATAGFVCVTWSPDRTIPEVNSGAADDCFRFTADFFKSFGFTIMLRLFHEFDLNPGSYPWAVGGNSPNAGQPFVQAWRRAVTIFQERGADNVGFWYCPLEMPSNRATADACYPGDEYVDWCGSDPYNWAFVGEDFWTCPLGPGWATFDMCAGYQPSSGSVNLHDRFSDRKPFVYGETGTVYDKNYPPVKGDWYRGIPNTLETVLPQALGICFFDQDVSSVEGGKANWLVDYGAGSLDGFVEMSRDPWLNTR
jgi:hypothetical protein